jgi:TolB-like protein
MPGKRAELSSIRAWPLGAAAIFLAIAGTAVFASRSARADSPATYDDAIKQVASQLADAISSSGKKAVAVSDFTDLDGNVTELGRFLAGDVSDSLAAQAKGFQVIDRAHSTDAQQAAPVDATITGSLTAFPDHVRLSAKLLDASNAAILGAASVDIPRTKDIDALLAGSAAPAPMKSTASHAAASSSASSSPAPAAAQANSAPSPAGSSHHLWSKTSKEPPAPKPAPAPPTPATPTMTGAGSVKTDAYRVAATAIARAGGDETVTLEFDSVGDNTVLLAMLPGQTYLTDETGVRWVLAQTDTAKIFNVRGGFWRGVPLAKGAKIQTVLTFTPQGPAAGTKFTLTISEFRPKWNRVVAIQGLQ